ncbi:biotin--[acetyl-CoA-carboxylase] ligase [Robbsia sp. KACC 23696]|uniref:biotin--[acetyl-CoA-carboxylase] ligase n=1 Tax=Robbsia sp. KACC 23696 TaxID=3149231 RepID=UPI00325C0FCA
MNTTRPYGALDSRDVAARLPDNWQLDYVDRTGSTNADLLTRWAGAPPDGQPIKASLRALQGPLDWATASATFPPVVRVADEQTAGRGRQGRPWRTVPGEGLLFSIAVVLPCSLDALSGLSLAVGLGIVEGLRTLPGITPEKAERIGLKWPNDILLDDAKLGGVLIETSGHGPHACAVVIGIGLNLRGTPVAPSAVAKNRGASVAGNTVTAAPPGLPPACLAMLLPEPDPARHEDDSAARHDVWRGAVLCAITAALSRTLSAFSAAGFEPMRDAWWRVHRFAGRAVRILDGGVEKLSGMAAGVDPRGQLLIAPSSGTPDDDSAHGKPLAPDARSQFDSSDDTSAARATWIPVQAGDVSLRLADNTHVRHRLLIDSGNSRLKWTLTDAAGKWLAQGTADKADAEDATGAADAAKAGSSGVSARNAHDAGDLTSNAAASISPPLRDLRAAWRILTPPDEIWISNVAGESIAALIAAECDALWPAAPRHVIRAQRTQCGLVNGYLEAERLGSDRWAGMIAARAAYPGEALLIATFGTATTIDTITAAGEFVGGWIAPGWRVMLQSLGQNTAQLPMLNDAQAHAGKDTAFGRTTREAIIEGCRQAQAGMILSAWRNWCDATKDEEAPRRCIVAGGAANEIVPALPVAVTRHDDLVLHGLSRIAQSPEAG